MPRHIRQRFLLLIGIVDLATACLFTHDYIHTYVCHWLEKEHMSMCTRSNGERETMLRRIS